MFSLFWLKYIKLLMIKQSYSPLYKKATVGWIIELRKGVILELLIKKGEGGKKALCFITQFHAVIGILLCYLFIFKVKNLIPIDTFFLVEDCIY